MGLLVPKENVGGPPKNHRGPMQGQGGVPGGGWGGRVAFRLVHGGPCALGPHWLGEGRAIAPALAGRVALGWGTFWGAGGRLVKGVAGTLGGTCCPRACSLAFLELSNVNEKTSQDEPGVARRCQQEPG